MVGGFKFELNSKRINYEFSIQRKITKVVGNSATGKTELVRLLNSSKAKGSNITVQCKYVCEDISNVDFARLLPKLSEISGLNGENRAEEYRSLLREYDNILFFCDESFPYLKTTEFANFCQYTDSFFVIMCRDDLPELPYAYNEIYEFHLSGKYNSLKQRYSKEFGFLLDVHEGSILVEDSNSGFEFFKSINENTESAKGNKNIIQALMRKNYDYVIADGAAIGSAFAELLQVGSVKNGRTRLCLPESFEYCLLRSEVFKGTEAETVLKNPVPNINGLFFSWERYFKYLISKITQNSPAQYSKSKLNRCYVNDCCFRRLSDCPLHRTVNKVETILLENQKKLPNHTISNQKSPQIQQSNFFE